ncbi:putative 2-aminoethylphosphonate ABC transporter substrate-binding protein [Moritella sp. 24]|uniref:putative 2-aminoethylphosphonate ABC transporter substrate-binding protein n=1 Tax=Moritella sp. 24 TaxID=2746230 RepID=UPI001BA61000|nr:putative 2-aminoethylphosphonate ABC transporter substrate-binding protein [Moritella sp. 24]QUM75598.1 putative 2-aminoethylphosphonate ABC transporter substrate-binding protein [Moritella sp. 24]
MHIFKQSMLATAIILGASSTALAKEELTVYTSFETDLLALFKNTFEESHPDIDIKWVRDSTGVMTAKLLAEGKNAKADVVWGLAGSSLALLKDSGIVKPYTPANLDGIKASMVDPEENKAWFGNDAFFNTVCFNTIVAKQLGLPKPKTWEDLLDPVYKGHIVMPNPGSSGTGYIQVTAWLQGMGEQQGWAYMDKLDKNIAHYTHSGSKPCVQSAMGETVIGISVAIRGSKLKSKGAPIDLILPKGIGWDTESVGLVNNNSDAAKALIDWSLSLDANKMYNTIYPVVGHKDVSGEVANYPNVEDAIVDMDFGKMANDRSAVLKTWSDKFNNKSEPKS